MMTTEPVERPRALVAVPPSLVGPVRAVVLAAGYAPEALPTPLEAFAEAGRTHPAVVVIDIAGAGAFGVRLISAIVAVSPDTRVFALVPFETLAPAAVAAGAVGAFTASDLRDLGRLMRQDQRRPAVAEPSGV